MPRGTRIPREGTRLPSLHGVAIIDEVRGALRIRPWPHPQGAHRSPNSQYWTNWLRAASYVYKFQPAKFQSQLQAATKGTVWMPRDIFISALRGRAWALKTEGRTYYPMAAINDVSDLLNVIAQFPGMMLYRGANLWVPIEPGENGKILTYHDEETPPTWETLPTPPEGAPARPPFKSGRYYTATYLSSITANSATTANQIFAFPFYVPTLTTFDRIAIWVGTATPGNVRLGVYADNGGTPEGGTLLLDSGGLSTSTTGKKEATINLTLQPGWYWLCHLPSATPSFWNITIVNATTHLGTSDPSVEPPHNRVRIAQAYGPLPNPFPASPTIESGILHAVWLRKA